MLDNDEAEYRRCRRKTSYVDNLMILGFLHQAKPLRVLFSAGKSPRHFLWENPDLGSFTMLISGCKLYRSCTDVVCRCHEIHVSR